jgi:hypothetical protein
MFEFFFQEQKTDRRWGLGDDSCLERQGWLEQLARKNRES